MMEFSLPFPSKQIVFPVLEALLKSGEKCKECRFLSTVFVVLLVTSITFPHSCIRRDRHLRDV